MNVKGDTCISFQGTNRRHRLSGETTKALINLILCNQLLGQYSKNEPTGVFATYRL